MLNFKNLVHGIGSIGISVAMIFIVIVIILTIHDSIKGIKKNNLGEFVNTIKKSSKNTKYILIFVGICSSIFLLTEIGIGDTTIGSIFEKKSYVENYYVNLFPENAESKNYKVEAEIEKQGQGYYIVKAYFPHSGYITFENYGYDESLVLNNKVRITDDKGKIWAIELTNAKVE